MATSGSTPLLRTAMMTIIVFAALSSHLGAQAQEQRCAELGEACLCSEPLDNADVYEPFKLHDPSDSTTKGCSYMESRTGGIGTAELPVPFPEGAIARRAFMIENDLGSLGLLIYRLPSDPFDLTGKTLCMRHYALYGKDHDPPGNIKIARIGHPSGMAWQASWAVASDPDPTESPRVAMVADPGGTGQLADCKIRPAGDTSRIVEFQDCQKSWCRFEICAEHDPGTGEHMVRAQWSQVGGTSGHEDRGNCGAPASPTSQIIGTWAEVIEYNTTSPPPSAGGSRYLSHAMVTLSPYDPDFWIGAACEIEGGCPDRDQDEIPDPEDLCPDYASPHNLDSDGNGIGDACECGDQDGNGTVDVMDLLAISAAIFDSSEMTALCDTNDDQLCDVQDVLGASSKILGTEAYCARYPTPAP